MQNLSGGTRFKCYPGPFSSVSYITKRYFIKGFNSYAKVHGEEQAFKALDKLKQLELNDDKLKKIKEDDDFQAMLQNALEA